MPNSSTLALLAADAGVRPAAATASERTPIASLVATCDEAAPHTLVREVAQRFLADPGLEAVALVEAGAPVGLVTRSRLLLTLARNFGYELFARKPVSHIADARPLVLPGTTPLADAVSAALHRRPEAVYDDVLVTEASGAFAGLLPVRTLVVQQAFALAHSACDREVAEARARDLERLDGERRRFLAHATHELRSPVNAIVMLAELVRLACERRSWEEVEQRVPVLLRTAATMRTTVGAMLDLSKLEAGRAEVALAPVDLAALAGEVAATAAVLVIGKPVRVRTALPDGPVVVTTDEQKLKQIVLNLAGNAAKFTDEGELELGAAEGPAGGARLWVRDTGIGIRPEDLDRLFVPFSQLEDAETKQHGGTGLGLAISRSLAEVLGARITVESEPGVGSTFSVVLPRTSTRDTHRWATASSSSTTTTPTSSPPTAS